MEQNRKVKFMKKKLSLILCLCFMALGLAACGTDPTTVDYFGMTYDELQSSMEQEVSALVGLTDDNRTYIQSYGSDTAMKLVESWDEATSDVGAYQGLGEFNITKAQKTLTAARRGYVDLIVDPADTRKYLVDAFELLYTKCAYTPDKKHGTK